MDLGILLLGSVILGLIIFIIISINRKSDNNYKDRCKIDKDCGPNQKCIFSKDFNRKICVDNDTPGKDKKDCVLYPYDKLEVCDPNDQNSCKECINEPQFACIQINYGKPEITQPGTGYTVSQNINVSGERGTGMFISVDSVDANGGVTKITITNPGTDYQKGDILIILSGNKDCKFKLTQNPTPYAWKQGGNILNIPESADDKGWCLPDISKSSISCNKFTADAILIENPQDKTYRWGCYCKIPANIDSINPGGDCTFVKLCGQSLEGGGVLYSLGDKSCTKNGDCTGTDEKCCWNDTDNQSGGCGNVPDKLKGYCSKPWSDARDTDPVDGVCDCKPGNTYHSYYISPYNYGKECSTDSCAPNGRKVGNSCQCNPGWVRCPEDILNNEFSQLKDKCKNKPQCLPDPCLPLGKFDGNMCNCNEGTLAPVISDESIVSYKCKDLCLNGGGCSGKGNCITIGEGINKKVGCSNCVCPYFARDRYYRYFSDNNKKYRKYYPSDEIANSWDPNWKSNVVTNDNCDSIPSMSNMEKKKAEDLPLGNGYTLLCKNDSLDLCGLLTNKVKTGMSCFLDEDCCSNACDNTRIHATLKCE